MQHRILIANNGLSALKFILSIKKIDHNKKYNKCEKLNKKNNYDNKKDLIDKKFCGASFDKNEFVLIGMATSEDIDGNYLYINYLDEIIHVESGPSEKNFGNIELIAKIAIEKNIDMVYPGWGHASENYKLPEKLSELGIKFIGPSKDAMEMVGDKIGSLKLCEKLKIPTVPWQSITFTNKHKQEKNNCIKDVLSNFIDKYKYPIMLKTSSSGGGEGITTIRNQHDLEMIEKTPANIDELFVCKLIEEARHIEMQVIADNHKNVIILGGRDCTLQRRYQKLIEESPPVIVSKRNKHKINNSKNEEEFHRTDKSMKEKNKSKHDNTRVYHLMKKYSKKLILSSNYIGVATVEFLYLPKSNEFYFLEINSRVQVEHPCTEIRYDIEIPVIQLLIALDYKIIKETIKKKDKKNKCNTAKINDRDNNKKEKTKDDTKTVNNYSNTIIIKKNKTKQHVIGIRIIAEDNNFNPVTGNPSIETNIYKNNNIYAYFSLLNGKLNKYADSQYGHIFITGKNRRAAINNCIKFLESNTNLKIRYIDTHLEFIKYVLQSKIFRENEYYTDTAEKIKKEFINKKRYDNIDNYKNDKDLKIINDIDRKSGS
ncbi:Acetyl-CoA carboxylase, partial [Spraguea lophii 42_110]